MKNRLGFAALLALGIGAAAPSIVFPGMVGALIESGRCSASSAATIVALELAGMMVGAAMAARAGTRIGFARAARFGLLVFIGFDLASVVIPPAPIAFAWLFPARAIAGWGEGVAIASMAAMAASLASAERYFAISVACNLAVGALLLRIFPLSTAHGVGGMFALLALTAVPALLLARALPATATATRSARAPLSGGVLLACAGTLLFFAAISAVWSIVTVAAARAGLTFADSSQVLAIATVAGIVTGLSVSWLGARIPRRLALGVGTTMLASVMAIFAVGIGAAVFLPVTLALMVSYVFTLPFYFGTIAALDRSGRVMAVAIALQFAGLAAGPALAAMILESGLSRVFWFACALCIAAGASAVSARACS
jgi:hypothetical protein